MSTTEDDKIRDVFTQQPFAIIGCSGTPGKAAHEVPRYLVQNGYDIIPVNPTAEAILDRTSYESLVEVPDKVPVVTVFRPSEEVSGIVDDVLTKPDVETLWLQLGISDSDAIERAEAGGITVIENRCMKIEHERLMR